MRQIFIATSNSGKLRDFAAAAAAFGVQVAPVSGITFLPVPREDAPTFEANACKKAEHYSRYVKAGYVLADDSGLEVDALGGAPGVHSARYAAIASGDSELNSTDAANNALLLAQMGKIPEERRGARFVCVIAIAREGRLCICFRGEVNGVLLHEARGSGGFGYDPLFFLPETKRTFAELSPEEKAKFSHRGQAFGKFLKWYTHLENDVATGPGTAR
jgi:XTP/dITP diphosphohydrolase